jgi:hypothetical protein
MIAGTEALLNELLQRGLIQTNPDVLKPLRPFHLETDIHFCHFVRLRIFVQDLGLRS